MIDGGFLDLERNRGFFSFSFHCSYGFLGWKGAREAKLHKVGRGRGREGEKGVCRDVYVRQSWRYSTIKVEERWVICDDADGGCPLKVAKIYSYE